MVNYDNYDYHLPLVTMVNHDNYGNKSKYIICFHVTVELVEAELKDAAQVSTAYNSDARYGANNAINGDVNTNSWTHKEISSVVYWKANFKNGITNVKYIRIIYGMPQSSRDSDYSSR